MEDCRKIKAAKYSATGILDLPECALIEILIKPPEVKDILHCRCVCKTLYRLLSQPNFVNAYQTASPVTIIIYSRIEWFDFYRLQLANQRDCTQTTFRAKMPETENIVTVLGSCNGLLCLRDTNWPYSETVHICNPIMKEYITLPRIELDLSSEYGLGFSEKSYHYKVVRIDFEVPRDDRLKVEIFTNGIDVAWRSLEQDSTCPYCLGHNLVSLHGTIYWMLNKEICKNDMKFCDFLCAFNVEEEKFRLVQITPLELRKNRSDLWSLGILGNRLCVNHHSSPDQLDIWTMSKNGAWQKEYSIRGYPILEPNPVPTPVKIWRDGEILISSTSKLVSFNPKENKSTDVKDFGEISISISIQSIFTPSFVSLKNVRGSTSKAGHGQPNKCFGEVVRPKYFHIR